MANQPDTKRELHANEAIKEQSRFLRGTIAEQLEDNSTGGISADNSQLTKFHGLYLQDDRDLRNELRKKKLERAFSFMLRVRLPGGRCTPQQWLVLDKLASERANGSLRLTTRQTFQFHGILKGNLRPLIKGMHEVLLDSIAACGDVNRNVMAPPNPERSQAESEVFEHAQALSGHLLPRSRAYHEIWLEDELVAGGEPENEPIYGATYLPRKFKIGFAVPPSNDVDVFSQDIGFIAIIENGQLAGYNVTAGGGLGMSHGNAATFPRLGDVMGFITPDQVNAVGEAAVVTQRDYGDRTERRHARLKYTIEDRGIEWFKGEVEKRSGVSFGPARQFSFTTIQDPFGWHECVDGTWFYGLHILSGRIKDAEGWPMKTALREIAEIHTGDFRLTPSQNVTISGVTAKDKPRIEAILAKHGLENENDRTGLRLNALSCVALPTCGLALAESEREIPSIILELEKVLKETGLERDTISMRMTGCPNGCARPYLAEIGIVGRAPGKYNLFLGAKYDGTRLNTLVAESLPTAELVERLSALVRRYAAERNDGEQFGDFCHRVGEVAAPAA